MKEWSPVLASALYMLGSIILFIIAPNLAFTVASALFFGGSVISLLDATDVQS